MRFTHETKGLATEARSWARLMARIFEFDVLAWNLGNLGHPLF